MLKYKTKNDRSLSEKIFRSICRQIISGKLKPGDRITELSISGSMGVSRAPVREALKRLAENNLVVHIPRTGCFVAELKRDEIEEIYDIRKSLECIALEYAWGKFSLPRMKNMKSRFEKCFDLKQPKILQDELRLDSQFHNLIIKTSGCKNVEAMLEKLRARIEIFRVRQAHNMVRASQAVKEHIDILDTILAGDKNKAIHALSIHIENSKQNILSKLE